VYSSLQHSLLAFSAQHSLLSDGKARQQYPQNYGFRIVLGRIYKSRRSMFAECSSNTSAAVLRGRRTPAETQHTPRGRTQFVFD